MSSVRRLRGRLFQIRGPTAPKLLSPKLLCVRGTAHNVIRGRPKGSSVAFGDKLDLPAKTCTETSGHDTSMSRTDRFAVTILRSRGRKNDFTIEWITNIASRELQRVWPLDGLAARRPDMHCHIQGVPKKLHKV